MLTRGGRGLLLVALLAACGSPAAPTPSRSPSGPPTSGASSLTPLISPSPVASSAWPAYGGMVLPAAKVLTLPDIATRSGIDHFMVQWMANEGPVAVFGGSGREGARNVYVADLRARTFGRLYSGPSLHEVVSVELVAGRVAWLEYSYATLGNTPPVDWWIKICDLARCVPRVLAQGANPGTTGPGGIPSAVHLAASTFAYDLEDRDYHFHLMVASIDTGRPIRTVAVARGLGGFAYDGESLIWYDGIVDYAASGISDTTLYISTPGAPIRELDRYPYLVVAADGRFAWWRDEVAGKSGSYRLVAPQIHTATSAGPTIQLHVSAPDDGMPNVIVDGPAVGRDLVAWSEEYDAPDGPQNGLVIWRSGVGARIVRPIHGGAFVGIGGGWLVWCDGLVDAPTVHGIALADLPS